MQNSVRALDQTGPVFRHLAEKFPGIRAEKMKEGVFIGPQIRQLFRDEQFDRILTGNEKRARNDFRLVATNFIGNNKAEIYKKLVENLLLSYQKLGCSMPSKMHFLYSIFILFYSIIFTENCGGAERGTRRKVSSWCLWNGEEIPGKWLSSMSVDCCWAGTREILRDLCTKGRWRDGTINQGKPVSMHYVKDVVCKASVRGDLISLENCNESSLFMVIFVYSVPKSIKGRTFHLRSKKKKSKFV